MMRTKKGFTLIELLVVVSIIALLVSILLPALNRAREQAKAVVCLSNAKSYGAANEIYAADYNNYYVPFTQVNPSRPQDGTSYGDRWPVISAYREILAMQRSVDPWEGDYIFPDELLCPSHKFVTSDSYLDQMKSVFGYKWRLSIGYNAEYWTHLEFEVRSNGGYERNLETYAHKATSIRSASEKMQWVDAASYAVRYAWADYTGDGSFWERFGDDVNLAGQTGIPNVPGYNPWNIRFYVAYRHLNNSADVIFFDGHGARLEAEEIYDDANPGFYTNLDNRSQNQLWDVKWPMAE